MLLKRIASLQTTRPRWFEALCFSTVCMLGFLPAFSAQGQIMLSVEQIKRGYIQHAATAQLHRWYQGYENNAVPLTNQLDLLTADVKVKSSLGEAVGHKSYLERFNAIPKTWKNAHWVQGTQITVSEGGAVNMMATIDYLNLGAKPDGTLSAARLKYNTEMQGTSEVLPKFAMVSIEPLGESKTQSFSDAYADNRLKSLLHYWLALIEDPKRRLEPFQEIFAKDFKLDFSSGTITDFAAFEKWFRGPASAVAASTHQISNLSYSKTATDTYALKVDFDWQGILPDGKEMTLKTRHNWTIQDDVKERFARLKTVQVEVLRPAAPRAN